MVQNGYQKINTQSLSLMLYLYSSNPSVNTTLSYAPPSRSLGPERLFSFSKFSLPFLSRLPGPTSILFFVNSVLKNQLKKNQKKNQLKLHLLYEAAID